MRIHSLTIALAWLLAGATAAVAAQPDISVGVGYFSGYTKYEIGGHFEDADGNSDRFHFPISELEFPVDSVMVRLDAGWRPIERLNLKLSGQTNVTDDTGEMEDSDWLFDNNQLDIYSESDTEMRAWIFEGSVQYDAWAIPFTARGSRYTMVNFVGVGLSYQNLDFKCYDLHQWYPSSDLPDDYVDGLVLKYEVEYLIPSLQLGMRIAGESGSSLALMLSYAPYMLVEDKDQHLLRNKVNESDNDWDGTAWQFRMDGRYYLNARWFLGGELDYKYLKSEAESKAYFSGDYDHTIDQEINSSQTNVTLMFGYQF